MKAELDSPTEQAKFEAALKHYRWVSAESFLRQCALALVRQHAQGEPIVRPLSFQLYSADTSQPRTAARRKYGHLLEEVAAEQAERENKADA